MAIPFIGFMLFLSLAGAMVAAAQAAPAPSRPRKKKTKIKPPPMDPGLREEILGITFFLGVPDNKKKQFPMSKLKSYFTKKRIKKLEQIPRSLGKATVAFKNVKDGYKTIISFGDSTGKPSSVQARNVIEQVIPELYGRVQKVQVTRIP
jgi:hypothetical protein